MNPRILDRASFPWRLQNLEKPPETITVTGDLEPDRETKTIAIVGSREIDEVGYQWVKELATACASRGAIVVSGGAVGVDRAAHEGALAVSKGRTWAVLATGCEHEYPARNETGGDDLYDRIAARAECSLVWPFRADMKALPQNFLFRNRILVALADVVVLAQVRRMSGSLNAAGHARKADKEIWMVPGAPWDPNFEGTWDEFRKGAHLLEDRDRFLATVLPGGPRLKVEEKQALRGMNDTETLLVQAASRSPMHVDDLCDAAGLSPSAVMTALLTLASEHVLVEGPPGYYRKG